MKLVDLTIANTSKTEAFEVLGLVIPKNDKVEQKDVPFDRANNLVIAASGIPALDVSVKGMTSTGQGLVTNELATLRKDNADLKVEVQQLTEINALNSATLAEQSILINTLTAEKAELQRLLDEALAPTPLAAEPVSVVSEAENEPVAKPTAKAAKTTKGATK
ncbi:MAG: hypothetical protein ACRCZA_13835 [Shewanella sp.]|uniref:hypothetical protein n=1 Tax=Shewanella sp. TaxID=50422 RepID=UPI003F397628